MTYTPPQPVKLQSGRAAKYRRTTGDVLRALGALVLLLALLGAVPFALVHFIGWPLPHQLPTTDALRRPLTSDTVEKALAVVVWLAWAQFTACVIVELANARRGVGIPAKVPAAGPSQFLARQLVAALLMLTATAASFAPDITHLANTPAALPKAQQSVTMQLAADASQSSAPLARRTPGATSAASANLPTVRNSQQLVRPASSRAERRRWTARRARSSTGCSRRTGAATTRCGRSPSGISGDGRRYKEIYELNKDRVQPDGQKLTDASLIRPGWILEMPADATGGDLIAEMPSASGSSANASGSASATTVDPNAATTVTNTTGAGGGGGGGGGTSALGAAGAAAGATTAEGSSAKNTGDGHSATASSKLTPANPQGVKVSQAAEDLAQAVAAAARAAEASAQAGAAAGSPPGGGAITSAGLQRTSHRGSASADERQLGPVEERVLYGIAGAPLLAAGLLLALGRHRRRQLWNRIGGRRPTTPTGDAAVAEESIRVGAGEVEVWFLDLALRGLAAEVHKRGRTLPRSAALRLRAQGIELMLAEALDPLGPEQAPLPWFTAADGRSWNFPRPAIGQVDADAARQRFAPYPGLVSIGTGGEKGEDRILVDLEDTRGVLAVAGPREQARALISAMAVELATNAWSDRMSITLVGFPGDLTPLAPARVRHVKVLDEILPVLEAEAAERAEALSQAGLDSVLDSRVRASQAGSFAPHFVLMAEEPHPAILSRLISVRAGHRAGRHGLRGGRGRGGRRGPARGERGRHGARAGAGARGAGAAAAGGAVRGDTRAVPGGRGRRGRAADRRGGRRGQGAPASATPARCRTSSRPCSCGCSANWRRPAPASQSRSARRCCTRRSSSCSSTATACTRACWRRRCGRAAPPRRWRGRRWTGSPSGSATTRGANRT